MKYTFCLMAAMLLLPAFAFPQSNFKPGYIVSLSGDTVKGTVNYKEWRQNPASVTFRDAQGVTKDYTPTTVKGFGVNGVDYFEALTVVISKDEVAPAKLKDRYDSTKVSVTAFLQIVTRGNNLTLYSYTDELKTRFLVAPTNSKPVELSYHLYLDGAKIVSVNRYRIQLSTYAENLQKLTPQISARIQGAAYQKSDLARVIQALNDNINSAARTTGKAGAKFFAGLSLNATTLKHQGFTDLAVNVKSHVSYLPQINAGVDFLLNPNVGRLILRGEVNAYSGTIAGKSANGLKEFSQTTFTIQPQVIYNIYNKEDFKAFLGAGFAVNLSSYSNYKLEVTNPQFTLKQTAKQRSTWYAPSVKAGVTVAKRIEISGRFVLPAVVEEDDFSNYNAKISSVQLGLNYSFSK